MNQISIRHTSRFIIFYSLFIALVMSIPEILFRCFYKNLSGDNLMRYFSRFSWGNSDAYIFLFLDLALTAICILSVFWLCRKRGTAINRYIYAFSFYCVSYHLFLSLFNIAVLFTNTSGFAIVPLIADLVAILMLFSSARAGSHMISDSAGNNRIASAVCLTSYVVMVIVVVRNMAIWFLSPESSRSYDPSGGLRLVPDPVLLISKLLDILTQAVTQKILLPDYFFSIKHFYDLIFPYWLLAFFAAIVFLRSKPAK